MTKKIVFENNMGGISVTALAPNASCTIEELAKRVVPEGNRYSFIDEDLISDDRTFRDAWKLSGNVVVVDMTKAKAIAHEKRRQARAEEFAPLDIKATIPAEAEAAEAARQVVREKYTTMQTAMDASITPEELKELLP